MCNSRTLLKVQLHSRTLYLLQSVILLQKCAILESSQGSTSLHGPYTCCSQSYAAEVCNSRTLLKVRLHSTNPIRAAVSNNAAEYAILRLCSKFDYNPRTLYLLQSVKMLQNCANVGICSWFNFIPWTLYLLQSHSHVDEPCNSSLLLSKVIGFRYI